MTATAFGARRIAELESRLAAANQQLAVTRLSLAAAQRLAGSLQDQIDSIGRPRDAVALPADTVEDIALRLRADQIDYSKCFGMTTSVLTELTERLKEPDFERLSTLRMSEISETEQADALEGWLRANVRYFDLPIARYGATNHIEFLLRRIDYLRKGK
jgi:hypothetical protein